MCQHRLSEKEMHALIGEAVTVEHCFVENVLPQDLRGINARGMKQYVCFVADTTLGLLGYKPLFAVSNPFSWMEGLGVLSKANFFEKRVSEYARPDKRGSRLGTTQSIDAELSF
jgi:ribonucleotide reductase beta subunit family protein with ferritin-like domain